MFKLNLNTYVLIGVFIIGISTFTSYAKSIDKPIDVLFIYPMDKGFPFWDSQVDFVQAVSKALDVKLEVAYTPLEYRNRFKAAIYIRGLIEKRKKLPDLVITSFWIGSEKAIMTYLNKKGIHLISINSDISRQQFEELGQPRTHFPLWLASLSPNDISAGRILAQHIIRESRKLNCPETLCQTHIFAISGMRYSAVSAQRIEGLQQVVKEQKQTRLLNVVYGNWDRLLVKDMAKKIFSRHNDIHAFWIASDVMAYGLEEGLIEAGINLPQHTIIGGIDWSPATINKIKQQSMHVSLGGHFMEAGWGLIMFYDYWHGKDFAAEEGKIIKTDMSILDKHNVDKLGPFLRSPKWSIDTIKQYSKYLNPSRKKYNLDPQKVIVQQLAATQAAQ